MMFAAVAAVTPAAAQAASPRIDLKVLLIGTSTTEPDFASWQVALQREGVPFDTLIESSPTASGAGHISLGLTSCTGPDGCQTLSTTLGDGTPEAKYQAVIVAVGGLPICGATCTSALSSSDWTALESYEHKFNIRQITGDAFPGGGGYSADNYGLNPPIMSGALDNVQWSLTTAGNGVFPYLNGPGSMDPCVAPTGVPPTSCTFGYEATPISTANFKTLVTGPSSSALVGIYTHPDGVQELVETYNQNQFLLQSWLLRHGAIAWATRGVYFGDQRNYLETHIDDNFLFDDAWSVAGNATTPAHSTDFNPADALRLQPADIAQEATWSRQHGNFRIDQLLNGDGSVAVANGSSLVGAGDSGSGAGGSSGGGGNPIPNCTATGGAAVCDPLLQQFTANDPSTNHPYTSDFGWVNHSWDHPNIDEGCATQNEIEAELNQNTNWALLGASGGDPLTHGLGLTLSTDPAHGNGTLNAQEFVPGEHSGLANLIPGSPGQVDPPSLNSATPATTVGAILPAGQYVYEVTDQFNTAAPDVIGVAGTGESNGAPSAAVTTTLGQAVTLSWNAVCHAGNYKIYRAPFTPPSTIGAWSLIGQVAADPSNDFADPNSTTDTTGGGPIAKTFVDNGLEAATPATPPATSTANESAYEQNPFLDAALPATLDGGIKYIGADTSKPYPNPADGSFATGSFTASCGPPVAPVGAYPCGASFQTAGATAVPRYPTNIYYNVSTNAQEVDEYQTLYDLPPSGKCVNTSVTTCNPSGTTFTIQQIVASVQAGMFQHMMGNDPRPHYFHQTNMMAQTTVGPNGNGDGLFYETMNPLLAQYQQYFAANAPIIQDTMAQAGILMTSQSTWLANTHVTGYIQGNTVTVTNTGGTSANLPLSGIPAVGSDYGGIRSGWTGVPAGTSVFTSSVTWPADTMSVSLSPSTIAADGKSTSTATATLMADGNPVTGDAVAFTSSDPNIKFGTVTAGTTPGTYTVNVTGSTTAGTPTITATDAFVAPAAVGQATLTQTGPGGCISNCGGGGGGGGSSGPPVSKSAPKISGLIYVGGSLKTTNGSWNGSPPIGYADQWQRCTSKSCANISGAKGTSYRPGTADVGKRLRVVVTATNSAGHATANAGQVGPILSHSDGVKIQNLLNQLVKGNFTVTVNAPVGGQLVVNWYQAGKPQNASTLVAKVTIKIRGKHKTKVKIKLTGLGHRLLKGHGHKVRLKGNGSFTPAGAPTPFTASHGFVIRS
jgi:Invasin, domain 3